MVTVHLLIRADGDSNIGTGHVMRMLALAEGARELGRTITFASARLDPALEARVQQSGFEVVRSEVAPGSTADVRFTAALAGQRGAEWIVADGYAFAAEYQHELVASGRKLLLMDDLIHAERYAAQLVVNASLAATQERYPHDPASTRLLLGPTYALLRNEVLAARRDRMEPERADHLLITMGGADPANATERMIEALLQLGDDRWRAAVVIGPTNPHGARLARIQDPRIELMPAPADLPALMRWAHLAISAAGITTYELAYVGVPSILIVVADNQQDTAIGMAGASACAYAGRYEDLSPDSLAVLISSLRGDSARRRALGARAREIVDGGGAARIVQEMV